MSRVRNGSCAAVLVLTWLVPTLARGDTYYVDWSSGSDANDGLSREHPWKRHPGMAGFAGRYTHAVHGPDRFVFRGGVTWPNEALQLRVAYSGRSPEEPDTFGVDRAWFSGAAWTRPIFDAQGGLVHGEQRIFEINGQSNIVIEGLEIRNQYVPEGSVFLYCGIVVQNAANVTVRDVFVHDWIMDRTLDDQAGAVCGWDNHGPFILEHSDIGPGGPTGPGGSGGRANGGVGARNVSIIRFNRLHGNPNTILGGGDFIVGNEIFNVTASFDPAMHENGIEVFQPTVIYGNVIHDVAEGVTLNLIAAWSTAGGPSYVFNNVLYDSGPIPLEVDCRQDGSVTTGAYVYNNVLEHGEWNVMRVLGAHCDELDLRNNVYITDLTWTTPACYNNAICDTVPSVIDDHNVHLTQAQARAAGMTRENQFRPTLATSPTIDVGLDLSALAAAHRDQLAMLVVDMLGNTRPAGRAWDVGPYEFGAEPPRPDAGSSESDAGGMVRADAGRVPDHDAGREPGSTADGGVEVTTHATGDCGCSVPSGPGRVAGPWLAAAALIGVARRRRARRKAHSGGARG